MMFRQQAVKQQAQQSAPEDAPRADQEDGLRTHAALSVRSFPSLTSQRTVQERPAIYNACQWWRQSQLGDPGRFISHQRRPSKQFHQFATEAYKRKVPERSFPHDG